MRSRRASRCSVLTPFLYDMRISLTETRKTPASEEEVVREALEDEGGEEERQGDGDDEEGPRIEVAADLQHVVVPPVTANR